MRPAPRCAIVYTNAQKEVSFPMALLQVNYVSRALMRTVTLHVVLPVDKFASEHTPYRPARAFPTLYLLHGLLGNYIDRLIAT